MNHSIHSADRGTHLKIVVVALVAGIAVAGLGYLGPHQCGLQPDRPRRESRQAGRRDQLGYDARPLGQVRLIWNGKAAACRAAFLFFG